MANVKTSGLPANQALASGDLVDLTQNVASVLTSVQATMIEVADFVNQQAWATDADAGGFDLTNVGLVDGKDVAGHVDDATIHFTEGSIDHGSIAGIGDDDHTQYVLADGTRDVARTLSASSGTETLLTFAPTVNQSGTASYEGLILDVTETATGSGTKTPLRVDVGGSPVVQVDNAGEAFFAGSVAVGQASVSDTNAIVHVFDSDPSGAATAVGDKLLLERSGNTYINIVGASTDQQGLVFSDATRLQGAILYDHDGDFLRLAANGSSIVRVTNNGVRVEAGVSSAASGLFHVASATSTNLLRVQENTIGVNRTPPTNAAVPFGIHRNGTGSCLFQCTNNSTGTAIGDGVLFGVLDSSGNAQMSNTETAYLDFKTSSTTVIRFTSDQLVEIGEFGSGVGQIYVSQPGETGARPVITLDQNDLSEEFMRLIGQSTTDATQSLVDAADLTTPGTIQGWFKVYVQDDASSGAITDGVYYVPFYSAPTA